jgi:hypothetical protein
MLPSIKITEREWGIIRDIQDIGYGEIYHIAATFEEPTISLTPSRKCLTFLQDLRRFKTIHKLVVHDKEPALAEYEGITSSGHKYRRKIKY